MTGRKSFYFHTPRYLFLVLSVAIKPDASFCQIMTADSIVHVLKQGNQDDSTRITLTLQAADKLFFAKPRKTLELLNAIGPIIDKAHKEQQIDQWHYYGAAHKSLGQMDSMEYYNNLILSNITREEDDRRFARALANLGIVYRAKGQLDEAAHMYEEALSIFENKTDTFPKGTIRNSLGLIYDAQGDYKSAMRVYLEALEIFESMNHQGAQAIVLNNMGRVYQTQQNYQRAIDYYKRYKKISQQLGQSSGVANAFNNIGAAFSDMHQLDSAEYYLLESVKVKEETGIVNNLAASLSNLGKVANLKGAHQQAIDYSERAVALSRTYNNKKDEAYSLLEIARGYEQLENHVIARSYYRQALALAEEMSDIKLRFAANEGLYHTYKSSRPDLAITHLEQAFTLKDSILNTENVEALTTLRLENEFTKKELINQQRITTLELQEALQAAKLTNQRNTIWVLAVVLIVLGYLLYKLFSQKNKIQRQNQTIGQALKEKDTLLREIHHRVKNNLQVISSLLGIQSRQVRDKVAIEALNEGRSRVQTMSLIHQDLYQHNSLTGIEIRTYFEKLIRSLFDTYKVSQDQIIVESKIEDLILDVDTVIPLGLVINELVSNALKYAFPSGQGLITVLLREQSDGLYLSVSDNGIGIQNPRQVMRGCSYGYELIRALVDKLEGKLEIDGEDGTKVVAIFKEYQKAA